jgi:hypothetical protein
MVETRKCIYRFINNCKSCNFKTKTNNKYCNIHTNNNNIVYDIISNSNINNDAYIGVSELYKIFTYIYTNDSIYVKELMFKTVLKTLFNNKKILFSIYSYLFYSPYHYYRYHHLNLNQIFDIIFNINYNTYMKINNNLSSLIIIKKFIYKILIKKHIYNNNLKITNTEDPFTFDKIEEIPIKERFIYNEKNKYYCFKPMEFKHFIETNGYWNPYTKQNIDTRIYRNLNIFIKYFKLDNNINAEWTSHTQAYTDVCFSIEKIGFYTHADWFLKLTSVQIKNIIKTFKVISMNNPDFSNFFVNINDNNLIYDFAREIIKLFKNGNSYFYLCCNFMKSLSIYSNDFYNCLPEWMSDIETPIIIHNHSLNSTNIVYLINIINS